MAGQDEPCCGPMFWLYLMVCLALVLFAGLMSGLTLGLMSLSLVDLEVLIKAGQPQDRINAAKILPVVKNQHLLLVTLLIGNALAMEALPIFLDSLVPPYGAILISVTLILVFGEIIPQAVCSRYGLKVGAKTAGVVRLLLLVFFPVSYPISKILDWVLGKGHFALMRRAELKTLVDMHGNEAGKGGELTHDETTIITGALDLTQKTAKDAMTAITETFSLDINAKLDIHTLGLIMTKGHSRVPIYSGSPTNIIGLILVKNLITCRPEDEIPVRNVTIRRIPRVYDDLPLYDIMNEFQKGHSHMAVVIKHAKTIRETLNLKKSSLLENRVDEARNDMPVNAVPGNESQSATSAQSPTFASALHIHYNSPGIHATTLKSITEKQADARSVMKRMERGKRDDVLDVNSDSLPSYSADEEVVGIITMEDVMEELLQEEILDETDEYVDVHNKIKINMLPQKKSSPISSAASLSHLQRRTPMASPFSPYHNPLTMKSPFSPNIQGANPAKTVSDSPARASPNSPAQSIGLGCDSPAVQASKRSPEKLQKDSD